MFLFAKNACWKDNKNVLRPVGVAQWTSHPPQEQKTRVRIPPGYKVFKSDAFVLT
jgi:hypothetical protein